MMQEYRLLPGKKHGIGRGVRGALEELKPGGVIELTDAQYKAFKEKFEPVNSPQERLAKAKEELEPNLPKIRKRRGEEAYDVINQETGEPINEAPLTKDEAEALAQA